MKPRLNRCKNGFNGVKIEELKYRIQNSGARSPRLNPPLEGCRWQPQLNKKEKSVERGKHLTPIKQIKGLIGRAGQAGDRLRIKG